MTISKQCIVFLNFPKQIFEICSVQQCFLKQANKAYYYIYLYVINFSLCRYAILPQIRNKIEIIQKMQGTKRLVIGLIGCFGGFCLHLLIGCLYQWGIVSVYVTSYFRTLDSTVTLEKNAIAFPLMMLSIGITMKLGLKLAEHIHPLIVMTTAMLLQCLFIFVSSFALNMVLFIAIYGVFFGLASGLNFMLTVYQCNKYFPGKKLYINGAVMSGTGLGPLIFGLFSYNYLNPQKYLTNLGYYLGTPELENIAVKVPQYLRYLALLNLCIGVVGILSISYMTIQNHRNQKNERQISESSQTQQQQQQQPQQQQKAQQEQQQTQTVFKSTSGTKEGIQKKYPFQINLFPDQNEQAVRNDSLVKFDKGVEKVEVKKDHGQELYPKTVKQAICTKIWWIQVGILFFGSCGVFLISGNYKTYVKKQINDDQFLTIIGVVGSIGNGGSRFLWNLLMHFTGYRFVVILDVLLQIVIYVAIRFTVYNYAGFLFLVFLDNVCIGGILGTAPAFLQLVFGIKLGSHVYGFFWTVFSTANLLQYVYVSQLSQLITFDGIIYVCLGMCIVSGTLVITGNFEGYWKNSQEFLGYFRTCKKKTDQKQKQAEAQKHTPDIAQQNRVQVVKKIETN